MIAFETQSGFEVVAGTIKSVTFVRTKIALYIIHKDSPQLHAITPTQAMRMREIYSAGDYGSLEIAGMFGVDVSAVVKVVSGKHYLTAGLPSLIKRRKT